MSYKIYTLKDPITQEIRYCGQTKRDVTERLRGHIYEAKTKSNSAAEKIKWILNLLSLNLKPIIEVLEECDTIDVANSKEQYYIELFRNNCNLTNVLKGGNGFDEFKALRISRSNSGKNNPMYGNHNPKSESHKESIRNGLLTSEKLKLRNQNANWKKKISDAQSHKRYSIDLVSVKSGDVLFSFKSTSEACTFLECTAGNIKAAVRNKRPIGKKIKQLPELCYVVRSRQTDA